MHIYLKHSLHGTKVAISDVEADYDEKQGWVRYHPGECDDKINSLIDSVLKTKRPYNRRSVKES